MRGRKLTDELQDIAMSIRMLPIAGVFNKMNRIVRDMCQKPTPLPEYSVTSVLVEKPGIISRFRIS